MPGPVLVVQDQALRGVPCDHHVTTPGATTAARSPHLLLEAVHHSGQQPRLLALLGVCDEEVHIMALQLPPAGPRLTLLSRARPLCAPRPTPTATLRLGWGEPLTSGSRQPV